MEWHSGSAHKGVTISPSKQTMFQENKYDKSRVKDLLVELQKTLTSLINFA